MLFVSAWIKSTIIILLLVVVFCLFVYFFVSPVYIGKSVGQESLIAGGAERMQAVTRN